MTLIDFAADKRAPTPTAAAEMAVPVRAELIAQVESCARRAFACWRRSLEHRRAELRSAARALPSADQLLAFPRQRLDGVAARLPRALIANARQHHADFSRIAGRLHRRLLQARLVRERERVAALARSAAHNARILLHRHAANVERAGQLLEALSYQAVLKRGFALVRGPDARPLYSAAAVTSGLRLDIEFADGRVGATADGKVIPKRTRRDRSGGPDQGSLF